MAQLKNTSIIGDLNVSGNSIFESCKIGGGIVTDFVTERISGTGFEFTKWHSGRLELRQLISFTTPNSTNWSSYITTGYYYGNNSADINTTVPFISISWWQCQLRSCGSNVGWVANSSATTSKLNTTIVRNGNAGTVTIEFYVIGKWK